MRCHNVSPADCADTTVGRKDHDRAQARLQRPGGGGNTSNQSQGRKRETSLQQKKKNMHAKQKILKCGKTKNMLRN